MILSAELSEAQTAVETPSSQGQLDEVVVTAEKRSENLQKAPIAVTALSADTLQDFNVRTTADLMQVAPGLSVATQTAGDGGGSASYFIRGLGQERSGNGSEPAVGIYVDGLYYPSLEGSVFDIVDLDQVEVLRGPQGTLFGRNTIGGAVTYTTKKPTDTFEVNASATVGSYGRNDLTSVLNVPLSQAVDVRLTFGRLQTSGYVQREDGSAPTGGSEAYLGRMQLRVRPTDSLTIDLSAQRSEQYFDGETYTLPGPIVPKPGTLPFIWNSIPPLGGVNPFDDRYASRCVYCEPGTGDSREFSRTLNTTLQGTATWAITNDISLKSLTGWINLGTRGFSDLDGTQLPIYQYYLLNGDRAFSQEFQINGSSLSNSLRWVGGLYYFNENITNTQDLDILATPTSGSPTLRDTRTLAEYIDASYLITDHWSLFGGARHSEDKKHIDVFAAGTGVLQASDDARFPSSTGRVGVKYQWTDDLMSYASWSNGFRAGGFNSAAGAPISTFEPEKDTSYEIGTRMDFIDHHVRINPTIFYTRYNDIQVQNVVPTPTGVTITLQNAARGHTYGFELESEIALPYNLRLIANIATLKAQYDDVGNASDVTVHSSFAHAPKLAYSVALTHTAKLAIGAFTSSLNWSWQDEQRSTAEDQGAIVLPSYGLLSARIQYSTPAEHWAFALSATNLANTVYYVGGVDYSVNAASEHLDLGRPREWAVSAKYKF